MAQDLRDHLVYCGPMECQESHMVLSTVSLSYVSSAVMGVATQLVLQGFHET